METFASYFMSVQLLCKLQFGGINNGQKKCMFLKEYAFGYEHEKFIFVIFFDSKGFFKMFWAKNDVKLKYSKKRERESRFYRKWLGPDVGFGWRSGKQWDSYMNLYEFDSRHRRLFAPRRQAAIYCGH